MSELGKLCERRRLKIKVRKRGHKVYHFSHFRGDDEILMYSLFWNMKGPEVGSGKSKCLGYFLVVIIIRVIQSN